MAAGGESASLIFHLPWNANICECKILDGKVLHKDIGSVASNTIIGKVYPEETVSFELTGDNSQPQSVLCNIPQRMRLEIWSYLSLESQNSVSQTCSLLRKEMMDLQQRSRQYRSTFQTIINMTPFLPLREYIDNASWINLRLLSRDVKTVVDQMDQMYSAKCKNPSRWCMLSDLIEVGNIEPMAENALTNMTTIFDIHTQDMKRIMTYLRESDLISLGKVCRGFSRLVEEVKLFPFNENRSVKASWSELNLMDLPSDVHERIFSFCEGHDRANLRLVSKLMQYQADTLAGVTVYLNDRKWDWNPRVGTLPPAHSLIVTNVENHHSVGYFVADYNCALLTRLLVDGPFPAKAMISILLHCKNLQYVGFTYALCMSGIEDELLKSFPVQKTPFELPSLKALNLKLREVELSTNNNIFRVHAWSWANAFEFMRPDMFHLPRLTSFYICEESMFTHNLMYEVAEKILKFLVVHRQTLKYVSIILGGNCSRNCNCPHFFYEVPDEQLRELQLVKFCHDCEWQISRPFTTILTAQKTLRELSCFKLSDWEFYAGVIVQNQNTLRTVKIEKNMSPVIDLSIFADCRNLEYLWISQCGSTNIGRQNEYIIDPYHLKSWGNYEPRLIGLDELPRSLRSLHIFDQTADTRQIRTIPTRLTNLETLEIQFLGSLVGPGYGLSPKTIVQILQLKKLQRLFLEEVRAMDDMHLGHPLHEKLSAINIIPGHCSQVSMSFGCKMYGILIAEKMPCADYIPEWSSRVSYYIRDGSRKALPLPEFSSRINYDFDVDINFEDEEEEADLYSNEASDNEEIPEQIHLL